MKPSILKNRWLVLAGGFTAAMAGAMASAPGAKAVEFEVGPVKGNFDTTISVGGSIRTQNRDPDLIAIGNGGNAASWNGDDGNLNFNKWDPTSLAVKATHELEVNAGDFGLFGRFYYFYDAVYAENWVQRTGLTESQKDISGRDIEMLDIYADAAFEIAEAPVNVRVGNQVLNWGESTFFQGINVINPFDVARLRTAGSEIREALLPSPIFDARVGIGDKLSVEGFYQGLWDNTEIDPSGTFFSTSDSFGPGGDTAVLRFGRRQGTPGGPLVGALANDNPPTITGPIAAANATAALGANLGIPRAKDEEASDLGQFGFALRYFEPALNNSEFGLYYIKHHSRLPLISGRTGNTTTTAVADECPVSGPGAVAGALRGIARYTCKAEVFREFPEDIHLVGGSFSTELFTVAVQGEANIRFGQPLQIDDTEVVFGILSALVPAATAFDTEGQLGAFAPNSYVQGYRRKDVMQAQTTLTKVFGPALGTDQSVFVVEFAGVKVEDMESTDVLRYEGPGTTSTGNADCVFPFPLAAVCGNAPRVQTTGFAESFSWGYRAVGRATYNNALGPVSLIPSIAFGHDVKGTTPVPLGTFVEGRKSATIGLGFAYQNDWRAEIAYTNFFGGGPFNVINDRDFLAVSASYSF